MCPPNTPIVALTSSPPARHKDVPSHAEASPTRETRVSQCGSKCKEEQDARDVHIASPEPSSCCTATGCGQAQNPSAEASLPSSQPVCETTAAKPNASQCCQGERKSQMCSALASAAPLSGVPAAPDNLPFIRQSLPARITLSAKQYGRGQSKTIVNDNKPDRCGSGRVRQSYQRGDTKDTCCRGTGDDGRKTSCGDVETMGCEKPCCGGGTRAGDNAIAVSKDSSCGSKEIGACGGEVGQCCAGDESMSDTSDDLCSGASAGTGPCAEVSKVDTCCSGKGASSASKVVVSERSRRDKPELCRCCVDTMLKEHTMAAVTKLLKQVKSETERIRRCCQALLGICCPVTTEDDTCCGKGTDCDDHTVSTSPSTLPANNMAATGQIGTATHRLSANVATSKNYTALLSGLDCPDCLTKVRRAITKLSGVKASRLDFVQGLFEFGITDETVDPQTVCRFVASVTGFGVSLESEDRVTGSLPLRLAIRLARPPSNVTIAALDQVVNHSLKGDVLKVTLHPRDPGALMPRQLMKYLEPFEPTVLERSVRSVEDRIQADLRDIAMRTLICAALTAPVLVFVWSPIRNRPVKPYASASMVLSTAAVIVGYPLYHSSISLIWYLREIDLGLLASVSILSAYAFSAVAYAFEMADRKFGDTLFETVTLLITLIFMGRTIQVFTRRLACSMLKGLTNLQPKTAGLLEKGAEHERVIDIRLIHIGDTIRVRPGGIVPTDGIVISGRATLDESAVSGEGTPVIKVTGNTVSAGNTLIDGYIDLTVTHLVHENSIASMKAAVHTAQSSDARFADLADQFASYLLPFAASAAIMSLLVWTMVNRFVRNRSWGASVVDGLTYAIAVLAVSCPCALALAVSSVVSVSVAIAVREGVIFRSADAFRRVSTIKSWAFDKTGTLSRNMLTVIVADDNSSELAHDLTHTLSHSVKHPVALAVHEHIADGDQCQTADRELELINVPGAGVETSWLGYTLRGGSPAFTSTLGHPRVVSLLDQGLSVFVVTLGSQLVAAYGLLDEPRAGAERLIADLSNSSNRVVMITGDNKGAAHRFATRVGLPLDNVHGGCSPAHKGEIVAGLRREHGAVAFVGDGINDSIALASSDVAISLGSGTDAAVSLAQVVLLGSNIQHGMSAALDLARISNTHVIAALVWCGFYFVFAILLSSGAFVNWRIPPNYAGLGELVSVIPVLLIAANVWLFRTLQLRRDASRRQGALQDTSEEQAEVNV